MVQTVTEQREAIVRAAVELLDSFGPEALRVRDIADAADCTTMSVYSRFGSKAGLLQEVSIDSFQRFTQALVTATDEPGESALDQVSQLLGGYRLWALDNRGSYLLMFTEAVPGFKPTDHAWSIALGAFQLLVDAVSALQSEGSVGPGEPAEIAWAVWGVAHGLVMLEMADVRPVETSPHSAIYDTATTAVLRGFAA